MHQDGAARRRLIRLALAALCAWSGSGKRLRAAAPELPFQKALEAASEALEENDAARLGKLEPYLAPQFDAYLRTRGVDLRSAFRKAAGERPPSGAEEILAALAAADIRDQLDFPAGADADALRLRIQLAYLDYHFGLSKRVANARFEADGYIRNCFRRAFTLPRASWTGKIIAKLDELGDPGAAPRSR